MTMTTMTCVNNETRMSITPEMPLMLPRPILPGAIDITNHLGQSLNTPKNTHLSRNLDTTQSMQYTKSEDHVETLMYPTSELELMLLAPLVRGIMAITNLSRSPNTLARSIRDTNSQDAIETSMTLHHHLETKDTMAAISVQAEILAYRPDNITGRSQKDMTTTDLDLVDNAVRLLAIIEQTTATLTVDVQRLP